MTPKKSTAQYHHSDKHPEQHLNMGYKHTKLFSKSSKAKTPYRIPAQYADTPNNERYQHNPVVKHINALEEEAKRIHRFLLKKFVEVTNPEGEFLLGYLAFS